MFSPITPDVYASRFKNLFSEDELVEITEALILLREVSYGMTRKDGITPEEEHSLYVAEVFMNDIGFKTASGLILCIIHDCSEADPKNITKHFIGQRFDLTIARWMSLVTKIGEAIEVYCGKLMQCGEITPVAVKLCDVLVNLRTLAMCSEDFQIRQIKEAHKFYLPLAYYLIHELLPEEQKHFGYQILRGLEAPVYSYSKEFDLNLGSYSYSKKSGLMLSK